MEFTKNAGKATCKKIILTNPDYLRSLANELERAQKAQAVRGESASVSLTETVELVFDDSSKRDEIS